MGGFNSKAISQKARGGRAAWNRRGDDAYECAVLPHTGILSSSFSVTSSRGSAQRPHSGLLAPATRPTSAVPPAAGPQHTVRALVPDGIPHGTSLQGSSRFIITVEEERPHGPHAGHQVVASTAVNPQEGHPFGLPSQHSSAVLGDGGVDIGGHTGGHGEDVDGEEYDPAALRLHSQSTGYPGDSTPDDHVVSPFVSPGPSSLLHAISAPLYHMDAPYATKPLPGMPPDSTAAPGGLADGSGEQAEAGGAVGYSLARGHALGLPSYDSRHVSLHHSLTSPVRLRRDASHGSPFTPLLHHLSRHHRSVSSNNNNNSNSRSISRARLLTALSSGGSIGAGFPGPARSSSSGGGGGGASPVGTAAAVAGGGRAASPSRSPDTWRLRSRSRALEGESVAARAAAVSQLVRGLSRGRGQ